MQFRKTALTASIIASLALVGCGGSSSSDTTPPTETPPSATQGQFIDAAVEGLYYVAQPSGKKGLTNHDGKYDFEANDTITFFLGGENGLRIGKVGARAIISPFEATGNYQKAINLARILQTMGDTTATHITLPQSMIAPSPAMIAALNNVSLHDMDSADDLLDEITQSAWISEDEALAHLNNSLEGLERGSKELLDDWQRGSGKYLRTIESSLSSRNNAAENEVHNVHADKLLDEDIFDATRGLENMTLRLDQSLLTVLAGSNDGTVTGFYAALYLTCLDQQGIDADYINPENSDNGIAQCNGQDLPDYDRKFELGTSYSYALPSPESKSSSDEDTSWEEAKQFGPLYVCMADKNCSENALTGFSINVFNDRDDDNWKEDVLNTSYDSISGVYTEVKKRTALDGENGNRGRISQAVGFAYLVNSPTSDRYVDFKGTWNAVETRPGCDVIAESTYVFDVTGVTVTGEEFSGQCETESITATATYADLAEMDYWWFTTNPSDSQATLTQLNSTIRWCDIDEDEGEIDNGNCNDGADTKFNRWEYAPAGESWDQGILNRRTLNSDGSVNATISMYKD